jgi:subtilisin family serine protease
MRSNRLHDAGLQLVAYIATFSIAAALLAGCSSSLRTVSRDTAAPQETIAHGHLVVVYRNGRLPADAASITAQAGGRTAAQISTFGISAITVTGDENAAIQTLQRNPEVATVLHDRYVHAEILAVAPVAAGGAPQSSGLGRMPVRLPHGTTEPDGFNSSSPSTGAPASASADQDYSSPQGWATVQAGGYGGGIAQSAADGPWETTLGAGQRIAILDSGIDASHPDLAPNLALNLSEIDTTAMPSPCDTGSAQDQLGHGSFAASLAAAEVGGGATIGVAPQAQLLNIKVLERMPATTGATAGATTTAQCEAGSASGLLSWVLAGLADAVAQHATVVSFSLGTLVDTSTGDGAGWKAQFDAATYAAAQAGTVLVASLGNDELNLGSGTLVELPAQAREVLAVGATTNPACAESNADGAACNAGPVALASYSNFGVAGAIAAPGGAAPLGSTTGVTGYVRGACSSGLANTTDGLPASGESFGCFGLGHTAYVQAIGTSAAAPLAAGAVALLLSAHPTWTPAQVIAALRSSATPIAGSSLPQLNLPAALALP